MLSAIEAKRYEITCVEGSVYKGVIMHEVWDQVVAPGLSIFFNEVQGGPRPPEVRNPVVRSTSPKQIRCVTTWVASHTIVLRRFVLLCIPLVRDLLLISYRRL